jgi:hypothetical protein
VHKRIIEATSNGAPMWAAAAYAGVSTRAFEKWMARGYNEEMRVTEEEGTVPDDDEQPYRQLFLDMQTARAQAVVRNAAVVQKAAIGGIVTEVTTKKYRDPGTGEVVEERTEKRTPPDWRASAWWLERRDPGSFGKAAELAVEVSGPGGGPVQVEAVSAADLAAKVRGNIAVLTAAAATAQEIHGADVVDADLVEDGEG